MAGVVELGAPVLDGGVQRVAWWNGRILTAEDLGDAQDATVEGLRRLGRAVGDGVAHGLMVTGDAGATTVTITPGVAVDRAGEVLVLPGPEALDVALTVTAGPASDGAVGFVACADAPAVRSASGLGVYLLTIASATGVAGSAQGTDGGDGRAVVCGPRYQVAGVVLRLTHIDIDTAGDALGHDDTDLEVMSTARSAEPHPRLRNVVAHLFLDTPARRRSLQALYAHTGRGPTPVEHLRGAGQLSDCEVPLALIGWGGGGVTFVDSWAVRRGRQPAPHDGPGALVDARARDLGIATLEQFAAHLADLADLPGGLAELGAVDHLRYFPAAASAPHAEPSSQPGIALETFLSGVAFERGGDLTARGVVPRLHAQLHAPPVDLDHDTVWVHHVADAQPQAIVVLAGDDLVGRADEGPTGAVRVTVTLLVDGEELPPGDPITLPTRVGRRGRIETRVLTLRVATTVAANLRLKVTLVEGHAQLDLRGRTSGRWSTPGDGGTEEFAMALRGGVLAFARKPSALVAKVDVVDSNGRLVSGVIVEYPIEGD